MHVRERLQRLEQESRDPAPCEGTTEGAVEHGASGPVAGADAMERGEQRGGGHNCWPKHAAGQHESSIHEAGVRLAHARAGHHEEELVPRVSREAQRTNLVRHKNVQRPLGPRAKRRHDANQCVLLNTEGARIDESRKRPARRVRYFRHEEA